MTRRDIFNINSGTILRRLSIWVRNRSVSQTGDYSALLARSTYQLRRIRNQLRINGLGAEGGQAAGEPMREQVYETTTPDTVTDGNYYYLRSHSEGSIPWQRGEGNWCFATPDNGVVLFEARASAWLGVDGPSDICIGFGRNVRRDSEFPDYSILIGENHNKSTAVRKGRTDVVARTCDKENMIIQNGNNYSSYWALYRNGLIQVGRGPNVGNNILLEWIDDNPVRNIRTFGFRTWNYDLLECRRIRRGVTPATIPQRLTTYSAWKRRNRYEWFNCWRLPKTDKDSFTLTFQAKSLNGNNIRVGFAGEVKELTNYMVLGVYGNSQSYFDEKEQNNVRRLAPDIERMLLNDEYVAYWVTYQDSLFRAGVGDIPGNNVMLSYNVPAIDHLKFFSFSSDNDQVSYRNIRIFPESVAGEV